jgi:2-keto-4-pentenoate hydratase/2-oxohepta-3-ene-1,7-dioic acid hydratase in catechol pathway
VRPGQGPRGLEQLPRADREDEPARAGRAALLHQVAECLSRSGATIRKPACDSRIIFEGELAVVIGRTCRAVSERTALDHVFGYTCANDVTAVDILTRNPDFAQWCRAKGYDTFCPLGPSIETGSIRQS